MILIIFLMMLPPLMAFGLIEAGLSPLQIMVLFMIMAIIPYAYMIVKAILDSRGEEEQCNK